MEDEEDKIMDCVKVQMARFRKRMIDNKPRIQPWVSLDLEMHG
jgi:hypothetical protein